MTAFGTDAPIIPSFHHSNGLLPAWLRPKAALGIAGKEFGRGGADVGLDLVD